MNNAIEVKNLTKIYGEPESGVLAVDHINFNVRQGEIFGFLGPNGAGKTTTQRMLTTLLEPTGGQIMALGHDLRHHPYPVKRQVGLVPEESNVYVELSGWDNLMFTARLYRVPREQRAERARELLETFGLWERRDQKVENYSRGMRRRLSIAMAIIHSPSLLYLDEPTPGLDAQSTRVIHDLIRELNAGGTTIFLTTHQIEEANQLCDRVAIINHGKIATVDTPENMRRTFSRTQSVEVAVEPDSAAHGEPLGKLPGVTTSVKTGDKWRLYTEDPPALLPKIMNYTEVHNLRIVSLNTLAPSLEDAFLEITGKQVGSIQHPNSENKPKLRKKGGRR